MMKVNNATAFHPLMQPLVMFISSSICLTVYIFKNKNPTFMVQRKKFKWRYLLIPTFLMLINVFQNVIGLKYLYNGLYTIMKSISIVSSIVMEKCFYPHRSYTKNQLAGLALTILGQAAIGIYSLLLNQDVIKIDSNLQTNIILGLTLLLISIFPMAFYYLLQERFMKAFRLDPLQYVGTQGLINSIVTIIMILSFQWLPCDNMSCQFQHENHFYFERVDVWWDQMASSNIFLYTVIILLIFFAIQMYLEFFIMKAYSGIACNVVSSLYTLVPYLYGLIIAQWFDFNFIHLGGFLTLIAGVLIFYHIPNFSQFQDYNYHNDSSQAIQEQNQFEEINHQSSFEDQLNPTNAPLDQRSSNLNFQNKDESEGSRGSQSSQKRALKQHLITHPSESKKKNGQQKIDQELNKYNPPNFEINQNNEYCRKERNQNDINYYEMDNGYCINNDKQIFQRQQQQMATKNQYQNMLRQQQISKFQNNNPNIKKPLIININSIQENQIYRNNNYNNINDSPSSYFEGRLSPSMNKQQQQILKSQNSQSNNEDDDASSIYYNNKFIIERRSKDNIQSNVAQANQNIIVPKKNAFINVQQNQNNTAQGNEQVQNDENSIISNNQKTYRHIDSGLWINQPNQRNKSNIYDQSILLLGSQISENGQSFLINKDTTPKTDEQKINNLTKETFYEGQDIPRNSSYIQKDFELYIEGKDSNLQQQQGYNFQVLEESLKDTYPFISQNNIVEEEMRNNSNYNSNKHSQSGKKQKSDKKILQPTSQFKEDVLLNQPNEDHLIYLQTSNSNQQIQKIQYSKQEQSTYSVQSSQERNLDQNEQLLNLNNFNHPHHNIQSPQVSPINHIKKKGKNKKTLILNI